MTRKKKPQGARGQKPGAARKVRKVPQKRLTFQDLLAILCCIKCRGLLQEQGMFLTCKKCRLAFPVLGGDVPDMMMKDVWTLARARKAGFRHRLKL